jgi:DNA-binding GntR family transcriptional regulator
MELHDAERRFAGSTDVLRRALDPEEREAVTFDWLQANIRFHDVILEASGSDLVTRMARGVRHAFAGRRIWQPGSEVDRRYEQMVRQHTAIREALAARSPRGARELSAEHVMDSWQLLAHILDEGADGGTRLRRGAPPDLST